MSACYLDLIHQHYLVSRIGSYPSLLRQQLHFRHKHFKATVLSWVQLVKSPNRQTEAQALVLSFETISQQIANKQFKTVDQMVVALRASNQTALGAAVPNWQPFFDKLQTELQVQADQGILVTLDQHAALWETLANILKTVR